MGDTARALIGSPRTRPALLFTLALALYLAPFAVGTEYRLFIATQMAAYVLVAIGLNLLNGYGGQVSLGHGALVAIGAYTVALAMVDHQWSFWLAALLAMVAAAAVGAVMALPAFRLSTWYFALITLGFAEVVGGFHEAVSNGVRDEVLNRAFVFQIDPTNKAIHRFDEHDRIAFVFK